MDSAAVGRDSPVRFGKRWFNTLWLLALGVLFLIIGTAVAQEIRQMPAVQAFMTHYPGYTILPVDYQGFPLWLRCMHFFNLFLMFPIIRAGIQLQLLSYFVAIFITAPLAIKTGLMQGPAIANQFRRFGRILHRQAARSIHFVVLCYFVFFIGVHVTMIFITGLRGNLNHMFAGVNDNGNTGFVIFGVAMAIVAIVWALATPVALKYTRRVQKTGTFLIGWLKGLSEWWDPNNQWPQGDISPRFWPNGTMPESEKFNALVRQQFGGYSLRIYGLVANTTSFSLRQRGFGASMNWASSRSSGSKRSSSWTTSRTR